MKRPSWKSILRVIGKAAEVVGSAISTKGKTAGDVVTGAGKIVTDISGKMKEEGVAVKVAEAAQDGKSKPL